MDLLKNTQFLKLWGNQILLQIAFNLSGFTALLLIDHITSSRFALAQFYAVITLPAFLIGIYAGSIVDLSNRKKLMLITDASLTLLFIFYIFSTQNYWALLLVAFTASSVAQFFTPAEAATIPVIVDERHLERANSLFLFTALGSVMFGYALAGPVIQVFGGLDGAGAKSAFAVASSLPAIGFFLLLSLHTIETEKPKITASIMRTTWHLTKEVFLKVKNNTKILLPIILLILFEFNVGMLSIIFIDFVKHYLKLPSTAISYFLILPLIAGLGVGVALMTKVQKYIGRGSSILAGIILFGLVIFGLGFSTKFMQTLVLRYTTTIAAFLVGICTVFVTVHARTILQENTPPQMMGRIFAFVTVAISATIPIPILLFTLIGEKFDVSTIFITFGIGLLAAALLLNRILRQKFDVPVSKFPP